MMMMMLGMMPPVTFMFRVTIIVTITVTTGVTHHIMALRLLLLLMITWILMTMRESAAVTGNTHDVIDSHTTGKKGHCQKETHNDHGDHHKYPCNRFQVTIAESLKRTGSYNTGEKPPESSLVATCQKMVDHTGDR
jgi:hypothetical protein